MKKIFTLFIICLSILLAEAQSTGNVGIGTNAPVTKLDVVGDLALREGTAITATGANPAIAVTLTTTASENSFYRITGTPTGTMTLNTIANGVDGQIITLVNNTAIRLRLTNNNAVGGILTPDAEQQLIAANGSVTLQYSATPQRWFITNNTGSVFSDWTVVNTADEPAIKTDDQYVSGGVGIGDFSADALLVRSYLNISDDDDDVIAAFRYGSGQSDGESFFAMGKDITTFPTFSNSGGLVTAGSPSSFYSYGDIIISKEDEGDLSVASAPIGLALLLPDHYDTGFTPSITFGHRRGQGNARFASITSTITARSGASTSNTASLVDAALVFSTASIGTNTFTEKMRITGNGRVGIGTTTPDFPLHVVGTVTHGPGTYRRQFISGEGTYSVNRDITAKFEGEVWSTTGFIATSDRRTKTNVYKLEPSLNKILALEVVDYNWIDKTKTSKKQVGVIAQELEKVIPEAVTTVEGFVPDVYQLSESVVVNNKTITIALSANHNLSIGDVVRIIGDEGEHQLEITAVSKNTFTTKWEATTTPKEVFVYGKYVNDFKTVSDNVVLYNSIKAIQELAAKVKSLENENKTLQDEIKTSSSNYLWLKSEIENLKEMIIQYSKK